MTRDKELARRAGLEPAIGPPEDYLLWYDRLRKADADTLYIVEGPFDAWKVAVLGRRHGIVATCLFTSKISQSQIDYLHELLPRFKHRYILLDQGTLPTVIKAVGELSSLGVKSKYLPPNVDDPGELDERTLLRL
jgi:hypothetical protein